VIDAPHRLHCQSILFPFFTTGSAVSPTAGVEIGVFFCEVMSFVASSFRCVGVPSSFYCVLAILLLCPCLQVVWVDACWCVACMSYDRWVVVVD